MKTPADLLSATGHADFIAWLESECVKDAKLRLAVEKMLSRVKRGKGKKGKPEPDESGVVPQSVTLVAKSATGTCRCGCLGCRCGACCRRGFCVKTKGD